MTIHIKICGITDVDAALAAVDASADSVGFVLTNSVREVSPQRATEIAATVPAGITKVAVFRGPPGGDIQEALTGFNADAVQADYRSLLDLDSPQALPVFRQGTSSLSEIADQMAGGRSGLRFVYEGLESGVGQTIDWDLAGEVSLVGQMTLAGGLTPENVAEAIRAVRPFGVDVSSGVESSPGVKDPARIRAFVQAVREAEKDLEVV